MSDEPQSPDSAAASNLAGGSPTSVDIGKPQEWRGQLRPVQSSERIEAIDVLRGVALLGILTMNIVFFAWPMAGYENPRLSGGDAPLNVVAWFVNSLFFSGKMMSLFSMLFGAGLVLMSDRATARGSTLLGVYYRRIFWLLVIGLLHAYLIWSGDILVSYAVCALFLYPLRRFSPRTLIIGGVSLILIGAVLSIGFISYARYVSGVAERVDVDIAAGRTPAEWELEVQKAWAGGMRAFVRPNEEDLAQETALYQGSYLEIVRGRAPGVLMFQIFGLLLFMLWGAGGRMLLGMALMKLDVFSATRSWRFYRLLATISYGIGIPMTVFGIVQLYTNDYDMLQTPFGSTVFQLGMVPMALGHAAVVMMICKAGIVRWLTSRLAAVGRTALTNYLMQSLLATTLFYGYGGNLFGSVDRIGMCGVVLAVWILQLVVSPLWLTYFRFGPAEWLWRSLTYWRWQPLRHESI